METLAIPTRDVTVRDAGWFQILLSARAGAKTCSLLCLLLVFGASGIALRLGVPHASVYGHDTFILLDASWRVIQGQRPHADFYSAFGPVSYLIAAAGLKLAEFRVEGLAYATSAVGLVLGIWALALARTRLHAWSAFFYVAWTVLFWLAPFPLGEPFYLTGYAMQYNRLGYVLSSLILIERYVPRERSEGARRFDWGGVSTGIAAALLLFLKVSYFPAACLLIAGGYVIYQPSWKHAVWVVTGFALMSGTMMAYLDWNFVAILHDLLIAAAARGTRLMESYDPFRTVFRNLVGIATMVGVSLLATRSTGKSRWGFVLFVLVVDLLLAMSNTQRAGLPLTLIATLILADHACRGRVRHADLTQAAVVLVAMVAILPTISDTVNGWGMMLRANISGTPTANSSIDAPHLRSLIFEDHNEPRIDAAAHNGSLYVAQVNDGLALLRRSSRPEERIACVGFVNPFSYALLRPPAHGGSPFFGYAVNFTPRHSPDATRILGDAELVMQPKDHVADVNAAALVQVVGHELRAKYHIVDESSEWMLWRRL